MANTLRGRACRVYDAPFDVKLSRDQEDGSPTVVQPDITVTCDRSKLTEQGMTGPPELVVEIVSPESGLIDRRRKFDLYERFEVKEYWIVDQDEKVVEVWTLSEELFYRRSGVFGPEDTVTATAIPELSISLPDVFRKEE
jgi:Uma2 family endonuclease